MHLTLKKEATRPAGGNFLRRQAKFDQFIIHYYNFERPHQALGMNYPAERYRASPRPYRDLAQPEYPFHDRTVTHCERICIGKRKIHLSHVFAGQKPGTREIEDRIWLVSFMYYDLGFFDHETGRVEYAHNPFEVELLPMSSE
jgi:putative transposase